MQPVPGSLDIVFLTVYNNVINAISTYEFTFKPQDPIQISRKPQIEIRFPTEIKVKNREGAIKVTDESVVVVKGGIVSD